MAKIPLGGSDRNFDSKKSRQKLINLIPRASNNGTYREVNRADGLTLFADLTDGPVRSNLLVNDSLLYMVSGDSLFRVDVNGVVEDLGVVGGSGVARIEANSVPNDSQILVLNGSGSGFVYTNAGGLVVITDPDFLGSTSVTILNERFWFTRDGTNEFFGSDISNGLSYNESTFGSAEESPDKVVAILAKKSSLWVLGKRTIEFWQTFDDKTFPLRRVRGATKERGILAQDSLAEIGEFFAFLADDGTVRMMQGTNLTIISDLDIELRIRGNGTATFPGFSKVDDAVGFFVDGPVNKIYYLTFPTEGYTWGYDIETGLTHLRESEGLGLWRANSAQIFANTIICGDSILGRLWELDPDNLTEGGNLIRTTIATPSISFETDVTIPYIEVDMEVGKTTDPSADPKMIVRYSKDGGYTFTNWGFIELGKIGDFRIRVPMRRFGRLVRYKDFILQFEITDAVPVQYYGMYGQISQSF